MRKSTKMTGLLAAALFCPWAPPPTGTFPQSPTSSSPAVANSTSNRNDFDILLNAVLAAGLEGALADPNADLTVFAPNDRAFIRLARDLGFKGYSEEGAFNTIVAALTNLGGGDPIPVLTNVLLYHVSAGSKSASQVVNSGGIDTLLGATVPASQAASAGQRARSSRPKPVTESEQHRRLERCHPHDQPRVDSC